MRFNRAFRTLIALILCVLLPLQAGATLARASAMARHGIAPVPVMAAAAAQPAAAANAIVHAPAWPSLAQGAHHSHPGPAHAQPAAEDHGIHAAPLHSVHDGKLVQPDDGKPVSHKTVHAKAGCTDCAKCCLLAASAPPPMLCASFAPAVARASFDAQRAPAPAFLTDGPDRPPRPLPA